MWYGDPTEEMMGRDDEDADWLMFGVKADEEDEEDAADADEETTDGVEEEEEEELTEEQEEQQLLEIRTQLAIADAEETCARGSREDCAAAWARVETLLARAGHAALLTPMWSSAPSLEAEKDRQDLNSGKTSPGRQPSDGKAGDESDFPRPSASIPNPCDIYECYPPEGTLEARGELERLFRADEVAEVPPELEAQLQQARAEAAETCKDGNPTDCAVAWEEVNDLERARNRKKRGGL